MIANPIKYNTFFYKKWKYWFWDVKKGHAYPGYLSCTFLCKQLEVKSGNILLYLNEWMGTNNVSDICFISSKTNEKL